MCVCVHVCVRVFGELCFVCVCVSALVAVSSNLELLSVVVWMINSELFLACDCVYACLRSSLEHVCVCVSVCVCVCVCVCVLVNIR